MTATATDKAPATLFEALARFQADLPKIVKGQTAKVDGREGRRGYEYDYADLADVSDAVLKSIGKLGLFFLAKPLHRKEDGKFGLEYTLGHVSGDREDGWWELRSDLPMQQMGGMITYARRYCLLAVTGAAPAGDDDDAAGEQQQQHNGRQSAGHAWENSTPAPPRQARADGNGQPTRQEGKPENGRRWIDTAITQAAGLKTEAEGNKLWREAAARVIAGDCTPDEATHVQNIVAARVADRRREASDRILHTLSETDEWREKVEGLADGDDDAAREALDELGRLKGAGQMDETRAGRIGRAIIARFPKAAVKAGENGA